MQQNRCGENLTSKDLIPLTGSKSKVSEVLSGKRTLSLTMIRRLNEELGISAEVLIQPYGDKNKKTEIFSYEQKNTAPIPVEA